MPSPFPGMDPYLEAHWLDVHSSLVVGTRNALNERLPDDLIARAEERVAVESDGGETRRISPDVRVFETVDTATAAASSGKGGLALAPYRLVAIADPITERFIEIIETSGQRLVSVVEFLSPTNKVGRGLDAFISKREELLSGGVNVIEIDLNRMGDRRALLKPFECPSQLLSTYRAVIRSPNDPGAAYLQPISLRLPLPIVRIPLRKQDAVLELALQPLIEWAYHEGRYARTIDYSRPLDPPLERADADWAEQLLRQYRGQSSS